jgi:FkbM family methyltransferase
MRLFRPRKGTLVYCGLYKGKAFGRIHRYFKQAIGFEPIPELFDEIQKKYMDNRNVKLVNAALAAQDGKAEFYIHDFQPASSLSIIGSDWKKRHSTEMSVDRVIEVESVNLCRWLKEENIQEIDTLIMDLQGYDLTVLKTMEEFVRDRKIRIIKSEVEVDEIPPSYQEAPSNKLADFKEFLKNDYKILKVRGKPEWSFHDITWIKNGERKRWWDI